MPAGAEVLSVEFKLLRPAQGETFVARAEVIKDGRTLTVVRADVFGVAENAERELVATMQGTMFCVVEGEGTLREDEVRTGSGSDRVRCSRSRACGMLRPGRYSRY